MKSLISSLKDNLIINRNKKIKISCVCLILFCLLFNNCGAQKATESYTGLYNNLYQADPTIYYADGKYYLYGTYDINSNDGIWVYVSDNLKKYSQKDRFLALKKGNAYGIKNFWAPQIWKNNNKYYMAYVADEHIALAVSDNLTGPFVNNNKPLIEDKKTIDPFIFKDDDGKAYLFHVEFNNGNKIYVAHLKDDLSGIYPETDSLCVFAQDEWEKRMANVVEGPTVLKHNGWYYLIYSANHFMSRYYAVGYAVSKNIYGPWQKHNGNPILSIVGTGKPGTGHGDIFYGKHEEMFYVFHTHNSDTKVGPRKTAIAKAYFKKSKNGLPDRLVIDQKNMYYPQLTP